MYKYMSVQSFWDRKNHRRFEPLKIPWEMISSHDKQAKANHDQDLEKLQSRGGVSACEALAILDERPWKRMDENEAHDELIKRITQYENQI